MHPTPIAQFLLARFAEEKEQLSAITDDVLKERYLATVEAKRLLVWNLHRPQVEEAEGERCSACKSHPDSWPCDTIMVLASPYQDVDGYDPAWKPRSGLDSRAGERQES